MLFCSSQFLVFFTVVFLAYWATPWARPRVWLLLAASFYFYASWNKWLAMIIFASTTLDYFLAHAIARASSPRGRKALVAASVAANLGLLCYFKYANFFLDSLGQALRAAGAEVSLPVLSVLLPIGISFYTFEAINYVVDVHRGHVRPETNLANFLLFILFFPHLVAGPIVRARDFLPQVRRRKRWSWYRAQVGVQLFLLGLVKKLVLADRMAMFADPVFADPTVYHTSAVWVAMAAYAIQIYGDFSGYSDMALGTAHLLGYHLAANFDMPYLARNVSEFWRRWHISLSTWLRDYLFIPLGGSRGGGWLVARNLLVTMTLGGLWHGASWNFVVWGLLHGLLLIGHRLFRQACEGRARLTSLLESAPGTALRVTVTCLAVCLCWVFFRAQTFPLAAAFLRRLVRPGGHLDAPMPLVGFALALGLLVVGHALGRGNAWQKIAERLPAPALGAAYAALLSFTLLLAPPGGKTFIYFQF
jgi:alginate O-acetyltransferase complex protein AlgI